MSRIYEINGRCYYSVTTILSMLDKPALVPWAAKMTAQEFKRLIYENKEPLTSELLDQFEELAKKNFRKQSELACNYGTTVHEMIEENCKGGSEPYLGDKPEEVQQAWFAWKEWLEQTSYTPIAQEVQICCEEFSYAGRFDAVAEVDGVITILDFKTSTGFYGNDFLYQLSAYWHEASKVYDITQGGILRLDKVTGMPEWRVYTLDELRHGWNVFSLLSVAYRRMHGEAQIKKGRKK